MRRVISTLAGLCMAACIGLAPRVAHAEIPVVSKPTVRLMYLIASNRTAQPEGVATLQATFLFYRAWVREQMELNGYSDTTFNLETEADGWTPKVYVVQSDKEDSYLAADMWSRVGAAADNAAGGQLWDANNVWFVVGEAHIMNPDGSLTGHYLGGTGNAQAGVAVVSGDCLAMCAPKYLTNNASYNGLTIAEIGPYPMVYGTTFGTGEGSTLSSVSSTYLGANMHEFGHSFHLDHDFRNDWNFFGNLMANGMRGMRGYIYSARYPNEFVRSSYAFAAQRNLNRYSHPDRTVADTTAPTLSVVPSGVVSVENGKAVLNFTVSDSSGLGLALLKDASGSYGGGVLAEQVLSGTSANFTFRTPYYKTTGAVTNQIRVQDVYGNETSQSFVYSVSGMANRCPWSNIKITPPAPAVGQSVTFDATGSSDPDDALYSVTVEWDFDNDGTFDTAPMACTSTYTTSFAAAGLHLVKVRLTDPHGAVWVSSPVGMRVGRVTHYVWPDSPQPEAPYNSWLNAAHTIQEAIDAAADGEEVVVAPSTYDTGGAATPGAAAMSRVSISKAVTVRSDAGPGQTLIIGAADSGGFGAAAVRCAYVGTSATLSGFTLTNGWTRASGDGRLDQSGGGALVVGGTVSNCTAVGNSANVYGGGVAIYYGGSVVNSTLENNQAVRGGGVDMEFSGTAESRVQWCKIRNNASSHYGGGAYCRGVGRVANSLVYNNTAGRYGGGIHLAYNSRAENCLVYDNTVTGSAPYGLGGGVIGEFNGPDIINCTVADNSAAQSGGGLYLKDGTGTVVNSIFYFNTAPDGANWQIANAAGSLITYSCTVQTNALPDGLGCVSGDPLFANRTARDYRIPSSSPALGSGDNSVWAGDVLDVAGNLRIVGGSVDMGAYEAPVSDPAVITYPVSGVTETSVQCGGEVTEQGNPPMTAKGLVWGTAQNPAVTGYLGKTDHGAGIGRFSDTITGLTNGVIYYVRAYASNSSGTVYGEQRVFTTGMQPPGNMIDFSGGSYVEVPHSVSLNMTVNYTLECWFSIDDWFFAGLISKYQTSGANGYFLRHYGDEIEFDGLKTDNLNLLRNRWYHVAAVNSNGVRSLYVNGVAQALSGTALTVSANSDPLRIGSDFSARYLYGLIDEVRIWNKVRSQDEIRDDMHRELVGNEANLVACYKLNRESGTAVSDSTAYYNDGTLVGGGAWVDSTVPCAAVVSDRSHLRGVWITQKTSLASDRLGITGVSVPGTDFAVFGHDNATDGQTNTADLPAGMEWRVARAWQAESVGVFSGSVRFDTTGMGDIGDGSHLCILADEDGVFTNATVIEGVFSSPVFTADSRTLVSNAFYTLAMRAPLPEVVTDVAVTDITPTRAVCGGEVISQGASAVTARGICWSTAGHPTVAGNHTVDGSGLGVFSGTLTNLTAGQGYYVRAYASNTGGNSYGQERSFFASMTGAGNTLKFDGISEYVEIYDSDQLDLTANYTLECWFRPESFDGLRGLISKYQTASANGYFLRMADADLEFDQMTTSNLNLQAGHWYHAAAVNSNGTRTLYVNGQLQALYGTPVIVSANWNAVRLASDFSGRYFDGQVDEVRIWNVARSEEDIRGQMHRPLDGDESGLEAYYRFDRLSGTTAGDATGNGHNGVLRNMESTDWVASTFPCAATIKDQSNLRGVWSVRTNSLESSLMSLSDPDVSASDFRVLGHDGGTLTQNTSDKPPAFLWRMDRSWRVEGTGVMTGDVRVALSSVSGLISEPALVYLLVDDDGVFANARYVGGLNADNTLTVSGLDLRNGDYYTIGESLAGLGTWYVDAARPDDSGNGTSWETAKRTIQAAVDWAAWGDTVLVAAGIYGEGGIVMHGQDFTNRVAISKNITVSAVDGPSNTFIVGASDNGTNGAAAVRGVWISDGLLTGFTVTNGHTQTTGDWGYYQRGGGVFLDHGGTVSNCVIVGCAANITGGGVDFQYGGTVVDCDVEGNTASLGGGGVSLHTGALLDRCVVRGNVTGGDSTQDGGGLYLYSGGTARNCLIVGNSAADAGGGVFVRSAATNALIENCTVVTNTAVRGGGAYVTDGINRNCVIYDNTATAGSNNWQLASGTAVFDHCCTTPLPVGAGNISDDPLFAGGGDYRLRDGSPCVNAGLNRDWTTGATDLDGEQRVRVGLVDMGAYEYAWRASGNALDFNGTNACVSLCPDGRLALTNGAFAIEAWIKPVEKASISTIFGHKNSSSANPGYAFYVNTWNTTDGRLKFETQSDMAGTVDPVIAWDVWQHVAVTWDGAALRFYVNGVEKAGAGNFNLTFSAVPAMLGAFSNTNSYYKGAMDEVRVWSVARGADELRDGMHKTLAGDEAGLLVYYRCDATAGSSLRDMTGNGLDGTLVKEAAWTESRYPVADAIAGLANLRGDWIAQTNSLASSILSVSNAVIASTDFRVFGHDNGALAQNTGDKPACLVWRLDRVWQVEGDGTVVGDVSFDCSTILGLIGNTANLHLVSGSGGSLAGADTVSGVYAGGVFTVSGVALADGASYTLGEQGAPVTITASAGEHGAITPAGAVSVPYNGSTNFVVMADTYWHIGDVTINGASVGKVTAFAWSNVVDDGTIQAEFAADLSVQGTPHWWLADHGLTGDFDAAESANPDNDPYTTAEEYVLDFDPTVSNGTFRITSVSNAAASATSVSFLSSASRVYTLLGCADLASGVWSPVEGAGPRLGAGGADALCDTNAPPQGPFYKVRVELP